MLTARIGSLKILMSQLLAGDMFDDFLLQEATINTAVGYAIDGHLNMDFFPLSERNDSDHPYEFQPWSELKPIAFNLIKGKNMPTSFRFILMLKPDKADALLKKEYPDGDYSHVRALIINIRYDGENATVTSGTSYDTFVMDKTPDQIWDRTFLRFLGRYGVETEVL